MTDLRKFYRETNRKWFGYDRNTSSPFWTGVRKFTPSSLSPVYQPSSLFVPFWPGLRALDGHPFSFNAFIYRPLLFLSTPSVPSLFSPTLPDPFRQLLRSSSSALLHSPASLLLSFVDTRLSRRFEDPNRFIPSSHPLPHALFLLLFRRLLFLPALSFNYSDDSSRAFLVSSILWRLPMVLITLVESLI